MTFPTIPFSAWGVCGGGGEGGGNTGGKVAAAPVVDKNAEARRTGSFSIRARDRVASRQVALLIIGCLQNASRGIILLWDGWLVAEGSQQTLALAG